MSKLLALLSTLKAILIVAALAFATGETLPLILISLVLNLAALGAKPAGQTVPRDIVIASPNRDPAADFHAAADSEHSEHTWPDLKTL
jgi:hypothetical protein